MTLYEYDCEVRKKYPIIVGVDEAGRGPLAGDVYAAAVILPEGCVIDGVNDSKKLSEKKREALFDVITEAAEAYCIATATVAEIEEINILNAAMLAMKRAIEGLGREFDVALIDGNKTPNISGRAVSVIKGDATSQSVAAASILAKVARDRYMLGLDREYPEYGFAKHKGYGTALHYEALRKFGPSPVHRMSFLKKMH